MKQIFCLLIVFSGLGLSSMCLAQSDSLQHQKGSNTSQAKGETKRRVEELANRFLQRWYETLDLKDLLDEAFVSTSECRHLLAQFFYKVHDFATTPDGNEPVKPEVDEDVDEALLIAGSICYLNLMALGEECNLALKKSEDEEIDAPSEDVEHLNEELKKRTLLPERITRTSIEQFIEQHNKVANFYRKLLIRGFFNSDLYKANLEKSKGDKEDASAVKRMLKESGLAKQAKVFVKSKGIFQLCFVKENGKVKLLVPFCK